jgi:shikimate kinase
VQQLRIILIGYRGTGKSTLGRLLAAELQWPFFDADEELEQSAGKCIAEIFRDSGEQVFRDLEEQVLGPLLQRSPLVLATGGGAILRESNRARLRQSGFVVWLQASAEELWERLQLDPLTGTRRPNLSQGGLAEVQELLAKREPFYQQTASFRLSTSGRSPEELASCILSEWRARVADLPPQPLD